MKLSQMFASGVLLALVGCQRAVPVEPVAPPAVLNKPQERLQLETSKFCARALPHTRVKVTARESLISESNERGIRSLTFSDGSRQSKKSSVLLGTTEASFGMVMNSKLHTKAAPGSGESCSRLELDVEVSMRHHTVHIAREFKPGTCAYAKVREHEYQHVAINNAALHEAASTLEMEMRAFFEDRVYYGDPAILHGQLRTALETHWAPRLQQLKDAVLVEHEEVDSAEEYESNQWDCEGEIPRILRADPRLQQLLAK